jgi:hypothetical protein
LSCYKPKNLLEALLHTRTEYRTIEDTGNINYSQRCDYRPSHFLAKSNGPNRLCCFGGKIGYETCSLTVIFEVGRRIMGGGSLKGVPMLRHLDPVPRQDDFEFSHETGSDFEIICDGNGTFTKEKAIIGGKTVCF